MDPITLAITTAISSGLLSSTTEIAKQAVIDLYAGLKTLIKQKYGEQSEVIKAVNNLEEKPSSTGRKETLKEEVTSAGVEKDLEILQVAQLLLEQLKSQLDSEQNIQMAIGTQIVQADRGSKASLTITEKK